jgi:hypothetical protein
VGHGGFGTTMAALAHGVPMVVVPLFAIDQHYNAAAVARAGAGVALGEGPGATGVGARPHRPDVLRPKHEPSPPRWRCSRRRRAAFRCWRQSLGANRASTRSAPVGRFLRWHHAW